MKKNLLLLAVMMVTILMASCSNKKGIYPEETKYMPVVLQGSTKWSILNVETGEIVAKDAFDNIPSPVVDDMFWVYNSKNRVEIYNVNNCKKPVNKETYGSATCFNDGYAIVSKPGEPLQVIDKQCNTVAKLSPSFLSATMFNNGRSLVHTDLDRYGFIDTKGDTVIKPEMTTAVGFLEDNVALVSYSSATDSTRVVSIIDRNGKKLYDLDTEKYQPLAPAYRMGVLAVAKKDSVVFLDHKGKEVPNPLEIPKKVQDAKYRDCRNAGDGRIIAIKGDRMGLVDKDNNILIPFNYQMMLNLSSTRYIVGKDSVLMLVDEKGKQVGKAKFINFQTYSPQSEAVRGYINPQITAANLLSFIDSDMACFAKKGSTLMDLNQLVGVKPEQYVGMKQIDQPMFPLVYSYIFDSDIALPGAAPAATASTADSLKLNSPSLKPSLSLKGDSTASTATAAPTPAATTSSGGAHFNYDANLIEVHMNFAVQECAPGTEEQLFQLMSRAMGSKGFSLNGDGTFISEAGTAIAMGYDNGVFKLYYYFDAASLKPLAKQSRSN